MGALVLRVRDEFASTGVKSGSNGAEHRTDVMSELKNKLSKEY